MNKEMESELTEIDPRTYILEITKEAIVDEAIPIYL